MNTRVISINHSIVCYPTNGSNKSVLRVALPKTDAGIRTIPMLDIVKDAFEMLYEEQQETGFNETNLKVIQSIMGHKNIEITLDIYAEATEKKKQESFENLAAKLDIF